MQRWKQVLFVSRTPARSRRWLVETIRCIEAIGRPEFTLADLYLHEAVLARSFPDNSHIRPKLRQQLQKLRDANYLTFEGAGRYRLLPPA